MMLLAALALTEVQGAPDINTLEAKVFFEEEGAPINPLIYGANDTPYVHVPWTLYRFGGNAATTYNWETNFDNAGSDWQQSSGYGWSMRHTPESMRSTPAAAVINHHETALRVGAKSLIQVNLMGYVAADGNGPVLESQKAPSSRWKRVLPRKPGPFSAVPDPNDDYVYVDEFVHHLVQKYGPASSPRGIYAYSLDNEPGLWDHTHPRAFAGKTPAKLLVSRSIETALAIKSVDPSAKIHGFAPFGVYEYVALTGAPDWEEIQRETGFEWFIDYYLDEFRKASEKHGMRLLDVLDLHFYVGGGVIEEGGRDAHLQAPRAMWDPAYKEQSWMGEVMPQYFPLIPRIKKSIAERNPGTELAFSEWNTEQPRTLAGGLSTVDMLGVFGTEGVDAAAWWALLGEGMTETDLMPSRSAFQLFRNFDGKGRVFGDQSLRIHNPRPSEVSIFASKSSASGAIHLIFVGKRRHVPLTVRIPLEQQQLSVSSFGFGQEWGHAIKPLRNARIENGTLVVELPKQSACHVVLESN